MGKFVMAIQRAVTNNVVKLTAGATQYQTNVLAVSQYVSGVMNSKLPTLLNPVTDWDDYVTAYVAAKSAAMSWVDNVLEQLNTVPNTIIGYNTAVQGLFQNSIQLANRLIVDPGDQSAKGFLLGNINLSISQMAYYESLVSGVMQRLQSFKDTVPQQASNLRAIADLATQDQRVDQDQINSLSQDISNANAEINSLTAAIVGLAIADGVAVILGVVAVAVAGPIGMVTWIFLGAAVAAATTFIVIDSIKINELKHLIEAKQASMDSYTADVAALVNTTTVFQQFADQAAAIEDNLQQILAAWNQINTELEKVQNDLNTASSDYTATQWQAVKDDFVAALNDWNTVIADVGKLNIVVQANTAQLTLGMSSSDVQAAMAQGTTTDFMSYIKKVA
jgi:hypothetical protein